MGVRVAALVVGALATFAASAWADTAQPQICIVPITVSLPVEVYGREAWRETFPYHVIPGLPAPVFTPTGTNGPFTISDDHRLIPYAGSFPHTFLDLGEWRQEPWSKRIVATTYGGGVSVLRPGRHAFERIETNAGSGPPLRFSHVEVLPRRQQTVVLNSRGGVAVVGDDGLQPWLTESELAAHGIHGIWEIRDLGSLKAILIVDNELNLRIVTDDGDWQDVARLDSYGDDYLVNTRELPGQDGVLVETAHKVLVIWQETTGKQHRFTSVSLTVTYGTVYDPYFVLNAYEQLLMYTRGGWFDARMRWRRLRRDGFEDIPGGDIGPARILPLASIDRTVLLTQVGLYFYDGQEIRPIAGGETARIGVPVVIADLTTIGHAIVIGSNGLLNLSPDGELTPIPAPFSTESGTGVADWPAGRTALVLSPTAVYALGPDLRLRAVPGGDKVGGAFSSAPIYNPANGELVIPGEHALFAAVMDRTGQSCGRPAP
jgi:hypothetical protein